MNYNFYLFELDFGKWLGQIVWMIEWKNNHLKFDDDGDIVNTVDDDDHYERSFIKLFDKYVSLHVIALWIKLGSNMK